MAKWNIIGEAHRYDGSVDNSGDQIAYGYRFDLERSGVVAKVNVEVHEEAPHQTERDAKNALETYLDDESLPGRLVCARDGVFRPAE